MSATTSGDACALPGAVPSVPGRTWIGPTQQERFGLLRRAKSIAIVGASNNPARASYFVATYLLSSTAYDVYLVNPRETEILGQPVYATLSDLPVVPDIVDVFRRHDDLPGVAQEAIEAERRPCGCSSGPGTRMRRRSRRARGSRWSWIVASRSNMRDSTADCIWRASTRV